MKNILVINGHEPYPYAEGKLNQTLFENIVETLAPYYTLETTVVNDGYIVEEEQEKFKNADTIIFQSPIYWFSLPPILKKYINRIYAHGMFYDKTKNSGYGSGGLFDDKHYMYSLTMNAPIEAFYAEKNSFFEGKTLDEVYLPLHKIQQYCGMKPLRTFAAYNVVKKPNIQRYIENLEIHLDAVFNLKENLKKEA